jgi:hypothetical protein
MILWDKVHDLPTYATLGALNFRAVKIQWECTLCHRGWLLFYLVSQNKLLNVKFIMYARLPERVQTVVRWKISYTQRGRAKERDKVRERERALCDCGRRLALLVAAF